MPSADGIVAAALLPPVWGARGFAAHDPAPQPRTSFAQGSRGFHSAFYWLCVQHLFVRWTVATGALAGNTIVRCHGTTLLTLLRLCIGPWLHCSSRRKHSDRAMVQPTLLTLKL